MSSHTFTLVPQGGLCNRLRALLSAKSIVEEENLDVCVKVEWNCESECAARFEELFERIDTPHFSIGDRHWYNRPVTRGNLHLPALFRSMIYDAQRKNYRPSKEELLDFLTKNAKTYASTGFPLCEYSAKYVQSLKPLPHLQEQIEVLSQAFDKHTVGVHIRRTDHVTAIAESPDELFIDAMKNILLEDSKATFYVATDDNSLKTRLLEMFKGHVIVQNCTGTRSNLKGMEEAVIDLWTLARTSRLLGSYWSSFTDTAAELGQIPVTIIKKQV